MATFSWSYIFKPREAQWWIGIIFSLVGITLALLLPMVFVGEDAQIAIWALRILGVSFLLLVLSSYCLRCLNFPIIWCIRLVA